MLAYSHLQSIYNFTSFSFQTTGQTQTDVLEQIAEERRPVSPFLSLSQNRSQSSSPGNIESNDKEYEAAAQSALYSRFLESIQQEMDVVDEANSIQQELLSYSGRGETDRIDQIPTPDLLEKSILLARLRGSRSPVSDGSMCEEKAAAAHVEKQTTHNDRQRFNVKEEAMDSNLQRFNDSGLQQSDSSFRPSDPENLQKLSGTHVVDRSFPQLDCSDLQNSNYQHVTSDNLRLSDYDDLWQVDDKDVNYDNNEQSKKDNLRQSDHQEVTDGALWQLDGRELIPQSIPLQVTEIKQKQVTDCIPKYNEERPFKAESDKENSKCIVEEQLFVCEEYSPEVSHAQFDFMLNLLPDSEPELVQSVVEEGTSMVVKALKDEGAFGNEGEMKNNDDENQLSGRATDKNDEKSVNTSHDENSLELCSLDEKTEADTSLKLSLVNTTSKISDEGAFKVVRELQNEEVFASKSKVKDDNDKTQYICEVTDKDDKSKLFEKCSDASDRRDTSEVCSTDKEDEAVTLLDLSSIENFPEISKISEEEVSGVIKEPQNAAGFVNTCEVKEKNDRTQATREVIDNSHEFALPENVIDAPNTGNTSQMPSVANSKEADSMQESPVIDSSPQSSSDNVTCQVIDKNDKFVSSEKYVHESNSLNSLELRSLDKKTKDPGKETKVSNKELQADTLPEFSSIDTVEKDISVSDSVENICNNVSTSSLSTDRLDLQRASNQNTSTDAEAQTSLKGKASDKVNQQPIMDESHLEDSCGCSPLVKSQTSSSQTEEEPDSMEVNTFINQSRDNVILVLKSEDDTLKNNITSAVSTDVAPQFEAQSSMVGNHPSEIPVVSDKLPETKPALEEWVILNESKPQTTELSGNGFTGSDDVFDTFVWCLSETPFVEVNLDKMDQLSTEITVKDDDLSIKEEFPSLQAKSDSYPVRNDSSSLSQRSTALPVTKAKKIDEKVSQSVRDGQEASKELPSQLTYPPGMLSSECVKENIKRGLDNSQTSGFEDMIIEDILDDAIPCDISDVHADERILKERDSMRQRLRTFSSNDLVAKDKQMKEVEHTTEDGCAAVCKNVTEIHHITKVNHIAEFKNITEDEHKRQAELIQDANYARNAGHILGGEPIKEIDNVTVDECEPSNVPGGTSVLKETDCTQPALRNNEPYIDLANPGKEGTVTLDKDEFPYKEHSERDILVGKSSDRNLPVDDVPKEKTSIEQKQDKIESKRPSTYHGQKGDVEEVAHSNVDQGQDVNSETLADNTSEHPLINDTASPSFKKLVISESPVSMMGSDQMTNQTRDCIDVRFTPSNSKSRKANGSSDISIYQRSTKDSNSSITNVLTNRDMVDDGDRHTGSTFSPTDKHVPLTLSPQEELEDRVSSDERFVPTDSSHILNAIKEDKIPIFTSENYQTSVERESNSFANNLEQLNKESDRSHSELSLERSQPSEKKLLVSSSKNIGEIDKADQMPLKEAFQTDSEVDQTTKSQLDQDIRDTNGSALYVNGDTREKLKKSDKCVPLSMSAQEEFKDRIFSEDSFVSIDATNVINELKEDRTLIITSEHSRSSGKENLSDSLSNEPQLISYETDKSSLQPSLERNHSSETRLATSSSKVTRQNDRSKQKPSTQVDTIQIDTAVSMNSETDLTSKRLQKANVMAPFVSESNLEQVKEPVAHKVLEGESNKKRKVGNNTGEAEFERMFDVLTNNIEGDLLKSSETVHDKSTLEPSSESENEVELVGSHKDLETNKGMSREVLVSEGQEYQTFSVQKYPCAAPIVMESNLMEKQSPKNTEKKAETDKSRDGHTSLYRKDPQENKTSDILNTKIKFENEIDTARLPKYTMKGGHEDQVVERNQSCLRPLSDLEVSTQSEKASDGPPEMASKSDSFECKHSDSVELSSKYSEQPTFTAQELITEVKDKVLTADQLEESNFNVMAGNEMSDLITNTLVAMTELTEIDTDKAQKSVVQKDDNADSNFRSADLNDSGFVSFERRQSEVSSDTEGRLFSSIAEETDHAEVPAKNEIDKSVLIDSERSFELPATSLNTERSEVSDHLESSSNESVTCYCEKSDSVAPLAPYVTDDSTSNTQIVASDCQRILSEQPHKENILEEQAGSQEKKSDSEKSLLHSLGDTEETVRSALLVAENTFEDEIVEDENKTEEVMKSGPVFCHPCKDLTELDSKHPEHLLQTKIEKPDQKLKPQEDVPIFEYSGHSKPQIAEEPFESFSLEKKELTTEPSFHQVVFATEEAIRKRKMVGFQDIESRLQHDNRYEVRLSEDIIEPISVKHSQSITCDVDMLLADLVNSDESIKKVETPVKQSNSTNVQHKKLTDIITDDTSSTVNEPLAETKETIRTALRTENKARGPIDCQGRRASRTICSPGNDRENVPKVVRFVEGKDKDPIESSVVNNSATSFSTSFGSETKYQSNRRDLRTQDNNKNIEVFVTDVSDDNVFYGNKGAFKKDPFSSLYIDIPDANDNFLCPEGEGESLMSPCSTDTEAELNYAMKEKEKLQHALGSVKHQYQSLLKEFDKILTNKTEEDSDFESTKQNFQKAMKCKNELEEELARAKQELALVVEANEEGQQDSLWMSESDYAAETDSSYSREESDIDEIMRDFPRETSTPLPQEVEGASETPTTDFTQADIYLSLDRKKNGTEATRRDENRADKEQILNLGQKVELKETGTNTSPETSQETIMKTSKNTQDSFSLLPKVDLDPAVLRRLPATLPRRRGSRRRPASSALDKVSPDELKWISKRRSTSEEKTKQNQQLTLAAIENAELKKELLLTKLEKIRLEAMLSCVMMKTPQEFSREFRKLSGSSMASSRSTLRSESSFANLSPGGTSEATSPVSMILIL